MSYSLTRALPGLLRLQIFDKNRNYFVYIEESIGRQVRYLTYFPYEKAPAGQPAGAFSLV